ncbi:hypothetical protein RF11_14698 [Thelohanellus kitauei]|uniref:Uncharacterized protein n=1 Tax=Thelohanellus kitauei TaxID=669202 RepID=A0A0C2MA98_THEKT|nr:hypothetical protein RF11_14698 [Thelohanellus kitauei]
MVSPLEAGSAIALSQTQPEGLLRILNVSVPLGYYTPLLILRKRLGANIDLYIIKKQVKCSGTEIRIQNHLNQRLRNFLTDSRIVRIGEALWSWSSILEWTARRLGDKIANPPVSSHDLRARGARSGFGLIKLRKYKTNSGAPQTTESQTTKMFSTAIKSETILDRATTRDEQISTNRKFLNILTRGNKFMPTCSRDSRSSREGSSNEEVISLSPVRAGGSYECHARAYTQTAIDRNQAQDSCLLHIHLI